MKKFSIVMAFRDTPRERKFAEKSIPSAILLQPDEFLIGVDAPANKEFLNLIRDLCKQYSFQNYRILEISRSPDWNFQLANIIWRCYEECINDYILAFDVDSVLRPTVINGLDIVGCDNNAVVSFTKKLLVKNFGDLIRYMFYRLRIRSDTYVFSGIYWIYRPYYHKDVDLSGMMSIHNGIDVYMTHRILNLKCHKIHTLKEIGVDSLDYQNGDYPWRQFQEGIWYRANIRMWKKMRQKNLKTKISLRNILTRILNKYQLLFILIQTITHWHPWLLRGWLWARKNIHHEVVCKAQCMDFDEWIMHGSKYVKNIRDWTQKEDGCSTGYE